MGRKESNQTNKRKGHLMLHHLAGAAIQAANLVIYKCQFQEDGKNLATLAQFYALCRFR